MDTPKLQKQPVVGRVDTYQLVHLFLKYHSFCFSCKAMPPLNHRKHVLGRVDTIEQVNQVWATDLAYIPMPTGFMYLMAIVDLYSRKVISWGWSNSMDTDFCCRVLKEALKTGTPQIFNTDQGSQFISDAFTEILKQHNIQISMDGKGRTIDNIFVERLWRSLNRAAGRYEYLYLQRPESCQDLYQGIKQYFQFYNQERLHQSLEYKTPESIYNMAA